MMKQMNAPESLGLMNGGTGQQQMQPPQETPANNVDIGKVPDNYEGMVKQFTINAMKIIHSPETRDMIVKMLQVPGDPQENIRDASLKVMQIVKQRSGTKDPNVNEMVVMGAGKDVMDQVIEVGQAANVLPEMDAVAKERLFAASVERYVKDGLSDGSLNKQEMEQGVVELTKRSPGSVKGFYERQAGFNPNGSQQPQPQQGGIPNG